MMDRPHCLYCKKTGLYMMWLKIMTGNATSFMSVLASPSFLGPYHFVHPMLKPLAMDTGDFTLVEEKGKGYFIFERPHFELITAELNDTFDDVSGVFSAHYQGLKPPFTREAPTYFNHGGHHYLLTSGTSGYVPNPSSVCVFDDFAGEYRDLGNPCVDDVDETSFYSQFTCVLNATEFFFFHRHGGSLDAASGANGLFQGLCREDGARSRGRETERHRDSGLHPEKDRPAQ
jgi:hypothetical protein